MQFQRSFGRTKFYSHVALFFLRPFLFGLAFRCNHMSMPLFQTKVVCWRCCYQCPGGQGCTMFPRGCADGSAVGKMTCKLVQELANICNSSGQWHHELIHKSVIQNLGLAYLSHSSSNEELRK